MKGVLKVEGRRTGRFVKKLKAQYFLDEKRGTVKECTITNIALKGMGIACHETINVGSHVTIIISIPNESTPVIVKGTSKWIRQRENDFIGGVELTETLDDSTFAKLV